MENRSRLPGEPSLDHPGVPTGRGGHRAGMKPLRGISARLFWGLPALPRKCSDHGVGASSPGKCRSPQTAPRLWRPYLGSIEPSRSPEVMLDAFRATRLALHLTPAGPRPRPRPDPQLGLTRPPPDLRNRYEAHIRPSKVQRVVSITHFT